MSLENRNINVSITPQEVAMRLILILFLIFSSQTMSFAEQTGKKNEDKKTMHGKMDLMNIHSRSYHAMLDLQEKGEMDEIRKKYFSQEDFEFSIDKNGNYFLSYHIGNETDIVRFFALISNYVVFLEKARESLYRYFEATEVDAEKLYMLPLGTSKHELLDLLNIYLTADLRQPLSLDQFFSQDKYHVITEKNALYYLSPSHSPKNKVAGYDYETYIYRKDEKMPIFYFKSEIEPQYVPDRLYVRLFPLNEKAEIAFYCEVYHPGSYTELDENGTDFIFACYTSCGGNLIIESSAFLEKMKNQSSPVEVPNTRDRGEEMLPKPESVEALQKEIQAAKDQIPGICKDRKYKSVEIQIIGTDRDGRAYLEKAYRGTNGVKTIEKRCPSLTCAERGGVEK